MKEATNGRMLGPVRACIVFVMGENILEDQKGDERITWSWVLER
jgi:hypothetical protein